MIEGRMSPLRRRMIEDMNLRHFSANTQETYIRAVEKLSKFLDNRSPATATPEDLRRFQLHLTASLAQPATINVTNAALRFFFTVTLDRPDTARRLTFVHEPRKLPVVLSQDEVLRRRRGPARFRNHLAQGVRHRQQAHVVARRAWQGWQDPSRAPHWPSRWRFTRSRVTKPSPWLDRAKQIDPIPQW